MRRPSGQRSVAAASDLTLGGQSVTNASTWLQMLAMLREKGVTMIQPQEIKFCAEKGMPLIDVRTADQYQDGFIEGAISVPLYQPIEGWEPYKIARRLGYAAFGVLKGTEPNPNFVDGALSSFCFHHAPSLAQHLQCIPHAELVVDVAGVAQTTPVVQR